MFVMACEDAGESDGYDRQEFINDGLSSLSDSESDTAATQQRCGWLGEGKKLCEALKHRLSHAKERQQGLANSVSLILSHMHTSYNLQVHNCFICIYYIECDYLSENAVNAPRQDTL